MRNPKDKDIVLANCDFYYDLNNEFKSNAPIHLEVGMGKGDFIVGMAKNFPNINFIGVEKYSSVAVIAIKKIKEEKLENLKVIVSDIVKLEDVLKNKIDTIYLNFSDPWPKDRHEKRRLTHENQLKVYDKLFKGQNKIIMKTDNDGLFEYSLESLKNYGYNLDNVIYDLHKTKRFNILTEYERKFSDKGVKIKYIEAIKDKEVI